MHLVLPTWSLLKEGLAQSKGLVFLSSNLDNRAESQERARTHTERQPAQAKRRLTRVEKEPAEVEKEPTQMERGGVLRVRVAATYQ